MPFGVSMGSVNRAEEWKINIFLPEQDVWSMFEEWCIKSEWVESEPKEWKTVEEM